jgi:hypothetical protein
MKNQKLYEHVRNNLNPHRDSRPPYQSEMVQWNDGYDKGYSQALLEIMPERDAALTEAKSAKARIADACADYMKVKSELENALSEISHLNARLTILQDTKGQ